MHRDTRVQEMVGDSVILREVSDGGGEVIRQENRPGGIVTAELCVLDDISRAPGEALNILLRILNERKFGGARIPLLCAIATANPSDDAYYNEPLDPANLDRFALQVKASGLIQQRSWQEAAEVIRLFASGSSNNGAAEDNSGEAAAPDTVSRHLLDEAYAELVAVEVTQEVKHSP
jgi:MoxR-like ATPase